MSVLEIKKDIFGDILEIQDLKSLEKVKAFLKGLRLNDSEDDLHEMTEEQKRSLEISIEQSENPDKLIPHEKVVAKYSLWGKEK